MVDVRKGPNYAYRIIQDKEISLFHFIFVLFLTLFSIKIDGVTLFTNKSTKGPYIYDVQTERRWGSLEFVSCLWILLFLNNRSIVQFCGKWGRGIKKLVIFCGRHKWMTPNQNRHYCRI